MGRLVLHRKKEAGGNKEELVLGGKGGAGRQDCVLFPRAPAADCAVAQCLLSCRV